MLRANPLYMFELSSNPEQLIKTMISKGDVEALEIFIELPIKPALLSKEWDVINFREKLMLLEYKAHIYRQQAEILSIHYERLGRNVNYFQEFPHQLLDENFVDNLQTEIDFRTWQTLRKWQLDHRHMLANNQEINHLGKIVSVDLALRVKLHKQFTDKIGILSIETCFNFKGTTEQQAQGYYEDLLKKISSTENQIINSEKNLNSLLEDLIKLQKERASEVGTHQEKKYRFLSQFSVFVKRHQLATAFLFKIDLNYIDICSGDNLMHLAIQSGQFETALFLHKKAIDIFHQNNHQISAIDSQDSMGNGLLHYLITQGKYTLACKLLSAGADCNLRNNKKQTFLDLSYQHQTFLQFLLTHINNDSDNSLYLVILFRLFGSAFNFSQLTAVDSHGKNVFTYMHALKNPIKEMVFAYFKEHWLNQSFSSEFQEKIRDEMWEHLNFLMTELSGSWVYKKLHGIDNHYINKQLKLLGCLHDALNQALASNEDTKLFSTLKNLLSKNKDLKFYHLTFSFTKTLLKLGPRHILKQNKQQKSKKPYFLQPIPFTNATSIYQLLNQPTKSSKVDTQQNACNTSSRRPANLSKKQKQYTDIYQWFSPYCEQKQAFKNSNQTSNQTLANGI